MKKLIYFLVYLAAAVAGVLLLIFNQQSVEDAKPILHPLIIGAGIVFVVPGIYQLIASMRPKRNAAGIIVSRPWFSTAMGIASLIWGILMLCMPGGFLGNLNITLGVSLIIAGLAQIVWIVKGRRTNGAPIWLYIIPLLVIAVGVIVLMLKRDFQNPGHDQLVGCIISGITLVVWAVNGFLSLPRRIRTLEDIERESRKLAEDKAKAAKEEAKSAKEDVKRAEATSEAAKENVEKARKAAELAEKNLSDATEEIAKVKAPEPTTPEEAPESNKELPEEKPIENTEEKDPSKTE